MGSTFMFCFGFYCLWLRDFDLFGFIFVFSLAIYINFLFVAK